MGAWLAKLVDTWKAFTQGKQARIVLVGLDAAGKTSILYKLKLDQDVVTIPTLGFNVEKVTYNKTTFEAWDIGGQDVLRPLWSHYYQNSDALIFVVDSNDTERIPVAADTLHDALADDNLKDAKILIYANKQDLPDALGSQEVVKQMRLNSIKKHEWFIQPCCAKTGDGLFEGLDWLTKQLQ